MNSFWTIFWPFDPNGVESGGNRRAAGMQGVSEISVPPSFLHDGVESDCSLLLLVCPISL